MAKRPSFQFYPSDWRTDQQLRLCSMAARGLWADMLCLMHEGEPYGHLTDRGQAMTIDALAKLVGEATPAVKRWIAELLSREIFSVTQGGVIFSRRMVRDEAMREARASGGHAGAKHGSKGGSFGSKGGRPKSQKGGSDDEVRGVLKPPSEPPPSSPPSSPASTGSEDKSSALSDPGTMAWNLATVLLTERGRMTEGRARTFFGGLLKRTGVEARDMFAACASCQSTSTQDPQSYLTRAAEGISSRKAEAKTPKRVSFV